ncbi:MAG: hypothetical protein OQK94_06195 [Gammaproteobacteria bacterium]|nr:hypothetical protein [Gammaproteobacteria bacterium]MCW8839856.1 hypothetical protein [Gammaproteobacteria bacterium]MCW8959075.1 hypothetical protein [Gammaproteobacteria bacterium]MCW8992577.1 hypothetical protein [Gammaproteobacteria bacterium]
MLEMIAGRLTALLGPLRAMSKENRELRDNALRAVSHALSETLIYYRGLERGKERNTEIEDQLSRYWAAAAIPIRHLDGELAMICDKKSEYWLNPEQWSVSDIRKFGIELGKVQREYRQLLKPVKSIKGLRNA